uniref:Uncharacterized protein n=1 Tax=Arundo donax TaxID=35708 RepID=A0A0A8YZK4_ARUDO
MSYEMPTGNLSLLRNS